MAEWEKEIAELKTDVRYIREDINIEKVNECVLFFLSLIKLILPFAIRLLVLLLIINASEKFPSIT